MDEMVILVLLTVLFNGLFDAIVVAYLAGRRSRKALENLIKEAVEGDEKAIRFIEGIASVLLVWATRSTLKTGKKITVETDKVDDEGKPITKEIDEENTPIELLSKSISQSVSNKMRSMLGNNAKGLKNMLVQEASETGVGLSPVALAALSRGKVGPAIAEVGLPYLMDMAKTAKEKKGNTGNGGW